MRVCESGTRCSDVLRAVEILLTSYRLREFELCYHDIVIIIIIIIIIKLL